MSNCVIFDCSSLSHSPYAQVIERDPSSHRGYERKHVALHGLENYGEAINAHCHMLSIIENSPKEEVRSTYL